MTARRDDSGTAMEGESPRRMAVSTSPDPPASSPRRGEGAESRDEHGGTEQVASPGRAEVIAYAGVLVLALVLRLAGLGAQPLSDAEAAQALVSWRLYQAQPLESPLHHSPLLATLNLVTFAVWGAGEFTARLWPALFGVLAAVLPIGLRRQLGAAGAVAASLLLTVSATALYLSRLASGDVAALAGGLAVVVGLVNWLAAVVEAPEGAARAWHPVLAGGGLILLVTSAPIAYSLVVLMLVFALILGAADRRTRRWAGTLGGALAAEWAARRNVYVGMLVVALAIATAFLFHLRGVGAVVEQPVTWWRGFASGDVAASAATVPYPAILLVSIYEPLILVTGLFGLALALQQRRRFDWLLAVWFLGGLVLDLTRSGRGPGDALLTLVPCALLGGMAVGRLAVSLWRDGAWVREGVMVAAGLVVCTYGYVQLMLYTRAAAGVVWLPLAAPVMLILLVVVLWQLQDGVAALRGGAITVLVVLFAFNVGTAVRLNYTPALLPVQPMAGRAAGEGLADLIETLQFVSTERVRDPMLVSGLADRSVGPAVEWQLRDFSRLRWLDSPDDLVRALGDAGSGTDAPEVLVTSLSDLRSDLPYAGQDFAIRSFGQPQLTSAPALIRWVILRDAAPRQPDRAILWVRQSADAAVAAR